MDHYEEFLTEQACHEVFMSDQLHILEAYNLMVTTSRVPEGVTPHDCCHSQYVGDYLSDVRYHRSEIKSTAEALLELVALGLSAEPGQYDTEKLIAIVNVGLAKSNPN